MYNQKWNSIRLRSWAESICNLRHRRRTDHQHSLRRNLNTGAERLEYRLMLTTTCPDDTNQYIPGDYEPDKKRDVSIDKALCYTGNITLQGKDSLTVNADIMSLEGTVTLELSHKLPNFDISALDQIADLFSALVHESSITIGSETTDGTDSTAVRISGHTGVTITADAGVNDSQVWDSVWSSGLSNLIRVGLEVTEKPDVFSLPVTVQVWKPNATILLENANIVADHGEVTIKSEATAIAKGKAVWNRVLKNDLGYDKNAFAAGEFYTDAQATVDVNSTVISGNSVEISTSVENEIELEVAALQNTGISTTNPKAIAIGLGFTELNTTSKVTVDEDSLISSDGDITIESEASAGSENGVKAAAYRDGLVGVDFGYSQAGAEVSVDVKGQVTSTSNESTESDTALASLEFNPAFQVDFETNRVSYSGPNDFETGDAARFTSSNLGTIPGLIPGNVYYLIVDTENNQLQFAHTAEEAAAGEAISLGNKFPTLRKGPSENHIDVPVTLTAVDSNQQSLILFGYDKTLDGKPLFEDGDTVQYQPALEKSLGYLNPQGELVELDSKKDYRVQIVESEVSGFPLAIQLQEMDSTPIAVTGAAYLENPVTGIKYPISAYDMGSGEVDLGVASLDASGETITKVPPSTPVKQGDALKFYPGLNEQVTSFQRGNTYWAIVDDDKSDLIRLADSLDQATAADPAIQAAIPQLTANRSGTQVTFPIGTFEPGIGLVFSEDPDLPDRTAVVYREVKDKPMAGLTDGQTYYAFNVNNTNANPAVPQYVLTLMESAEASPGIMMGSDASRGTFTLTVQVTEEETATTSELAWNASSQEVATAINELDVSGVTVTGAGKLSDPWEIYGLDPSQLNVDSLQLLDSIDQQTNMQMTSANQVEFTYGQSLKDPESGTIFEITGANIDNGQIKLKLSDPAPVTQVDSMNLTGGEASFSSLDAGALQMFSFATEGSFSLTVTDRNGNASSTGALAYNIAPADLADRLNDLSGVDSVSAIGQGNLLSPWLISGLEQDSVSVDSSLLTWDGSPTSMVTDVLNSPVDKVWTDADGGDFTLTLSTAGQSVTTAPIAFDASAADVNIALRALSGVTSQVTGSGQAGDPWVLHSHSQPILTGDPLTFQDSWNLPGMGLLNGETYYAVNPEQTLDPQTLVIGLAASVADANTTTPTLVDMRPYIPLTSGPPTLMTGGTVTLTEEPEPTGITVTASLESENSASSTSTLGSFPLLAYFVNAGKEGENNYVNRKSKIEREIEEKIPRDLEQFSNSFELSGAIAVQNVDNTVEAKIRPTGKIASSGNVTVKSYINENVSTLVDTGLSKSAVNKNGNQGAVAIAIGVAVVENTSTAVVESDAFVTGGDAVEVSSEIEYEPPWSSWTNWSKNDKEDNASNVIDVIKNLAFGDVGFLSSAFNTTANVGVPGNQEKMDYVVTGSFTVETITNTNLAQIADGAQINQTFDFQQWDAGNSTRKSAPPFVLSNENTVTVHAETTVEQIGLAGQLYIALPFLFDGIKKDDKLNSVAPFQSAAKNAFGGSVTFFVMKEDTQALIGGAYPDNSDGSQNPTNIKYGNGGLNVTAESQSTIVQIGQATGNSSRWGVEGSLAYLLIGEPLDSDADRGKTVGAQIITENSPVNLVAVDGTTGAVDVSAEDTSDLWAVSGAVLLGTTKGIGISGSTVEFTRDVVAAVGSKTQGGTAKTSSLNSPGDFTIDAVSDGTIVPLSIVGVFPSTRNGAELFKNHVPNENQDAAANNNQGKWGLGLSGDFAGAFVDDQTYAYLNDRGSAFGSKSDGDNFNTLKISSSNNTSLNPIAGQAVIAVSEGLAVSEADNKSLAGIAGSVAMAVVDSDVQAFLGNTTIQSFALELEARNDKKIGSCAAGLQVARPTGADLQIAGSVVVNEITNTTQASIAKLTATDNIGEISITALSTDEIWGAAGTIAVTFDRRSLGEQENRPEAKTVFGVGMSAVWNEIDNTTTAEVTDSPISQSDGRVTVAAEDFTESRVLSAGVDVVVPAGTSVEIGGMWATNFLHPTTTAQIENSSIESVSKNTEPLLVTAVLAPVLQSFAGYFSLDIGKPLSRDNDQLGIGVGAAVVVTRLGDEEGDSETLAQINDSPVAWSGNVTVQAHTGELNPDTEKYVPDQSQAADFSEDKNVHSLAIAGSAQGQDSAKSKFELGLVVNGAVIVTDSQVGTTALLEKSVIKPADSESNSKPTVAVLATNQLTYLTDAGGVAMSGSIAVKGKSVQIAVGGADNSFTSTNSTSATVEQAEEVTAASLQVAATLSPDIENYAFGVAVSVAISPAGDGGGLGCSGAFLQLNQTDTAEAGITKSTVTVDQFISVKADDTSTVQTSTGAGSLQISLSGVGAVAIAPSAVTNKVTLNNQVLAWIGSKPLTDKSAPLVDQAASDSSSVTAGGMITVQATCKRDVDTVAVAAAVSVALAPEYNSFALSGSGASSSVTTNGIVKAAANGIQSLTLSGTDKSTISAKAEGTVNASVGSGAGSIGWVGGAIGVSLAEIHNNDQIVAEIENSQITTGPIGSPVSVTAADKVQYNTKSVATSLSIAIGGAAAGGNSNITSKPKVVADVGQGTTITPTPDGIPGELTVSAEGAETINAQMYGGTLGLGSAGGFRSDVHKDGLIRAGVGHAKNGLELENLSVTANSHHKIDTSGYSITVGGLAGSGETHRFEYEDKIIACLGADFDVNSEDDCSAGDSMVPLPKINVAGDSIVSATANTTASSSDTGDPGTDQEGYNIGGLGVGVFKTYSTYSPVLKTVVTDLHLMGEGGLDLEAVVSGESNSRAVSGSGGLIAGDATHANNTIAPEASVILDGAQIDMMKNGADASLIAQTNVNYDTYSNAIQASLAGGSGARVYNTFTPNAEITLKSHSRLTNQGPISLWSDNTIKRKPDTDDAKVDKNNVFGALNSVRGGAGGVIEGAGASADTTYNGTATIQLGSAADDTAEITSNSTDSSGVSILATQQIRSEEFVAQEVGGLVPIGRVNNTLTIELTNKVEANNANVNATGDLAIATAVDVETVTESLAQSQGIGSAYSNASVDVTTTETISISGDSGSTIIANDVTIAAGGHQAPIKVGISPQISSASLAFSHGMVHSHDADMTISQDNSIEIAKGTHVAATLDNVRIDATPESTSNSYHQSAGAMSVGVFDRADMKAQPVTPTKNLKVIIDGMVTAASPQMSVDLSVDDIKNTVNLDVNNQQYSVPIAADEFSDQLIADQGNDPSNPFVSFLAAANQSTNVDLSKSDLDPATIKQIKSRSSLPEDFPAFRLQNMIVPQGSILVISDTIEGTGSLNANISELTINNPTDFWLILDGINSPGNPQAGEIVLRKTSGEMFDDAPDKLDLQPAENPTPTITVSLTSSDDSPNTHSPPGLVISGALNAPSSDVTLSNQNGPIIELAPINARSVTISSPNSAFVVDIPNAYWGAGGDFGPAFEQAAKLNPLHPPADDNASTTTAYPQYPQYRLGNTPFRPGWKQQDEYTAWDANLLATAAADSLYAGSQPNDLSDFAKFLTDQNAVLFGNCRYIAAGCDNSSQGAASHVGSGRGFLKNETSSTYQASDGTDYPLVVPSLPVEAMGWTESVSQQLTGSVTAAQLFINAETIDVNAPINIGKLHNLSIIFDEALGTKLALYRIDYQIGLEPNPLYEIPGIGAQASDISATYDARTNDITLSAVNSAAHMTAFLEGQIISTLEGSLINMMGGLGLASIQNNSGIPLILNDIDSGTAAVRANVEFRDHLSGINTRYEYRVNEGVAVYTTTAGDNYPETPDAVQQFDSVQYQPVPGTLLSNVEEQDVFRTFGELSVSEDGEDEAWSPNGSWNFGEVHTVGFDDFLFVNPAQEKSSSEYPLSLTTTTNQASAAWLTKPLDITRDFTVSFHYESQPGNTNDIADGITFAFQTQQPRNDLVGKPGGNLGYVGLTDPTAAYQINLFESNTRGTNFVTKNTNESYQNTSPVELCSTDHKHRTLQVQLYYNAEEHKVYETLTQGSNGVYTNSYEANLQETFDNKTVYVGFTGGTGTQDSKQSIKNFLLAYDPSHSSPNIQSGTPWQVGDISTVQGFSDFTAVAATPFTADVRADSIQLTDGEVDTATAAWLDRKIPTGFGFTLDFTYQADGTKAADGVALVFQNQGKKAVGNSGGSLGYEGITGETAAYKINIYEQNQSGTLFTTSSSSNNNYLSTDPVKLASGNPIQINLIYDPISQTITETLVDTISKTSYQRKHQNVDLSDVGSTTFIGFTGGSGGETAIQTVSDFHLTFLQGFDDFTGGIGKPFTSAAGKSAQVTATVNTNQIELTNGEAVIATAAWLSQPIPIDKDFRVGFTYEGSGESDGIALVWQNQGLKAVGNNGSSLGFVGITGNTAAYQMNLYNYAQGSNLITGTNFVTTNTSGDYRATGDVKLNSGNPIKVQLAYDADQKKLTETLADPTEGTSYQHIYDDVDFSSSLGAYEAVMNGNFETNADRFTVWPGYIGGENPDEIAGWTGSGLYGINPIADGNAPFRDNGNNKTHVAFLQGESSLEQTITNFEVGTNYTLGIDFNSREWGGAFPIGKVYVNDVWIGNLTGGSNNNTQVIPVGGNNSWYNVDLPFPANSDVNTIRIESMPSDEGDTTLLIDNVTLTLSTKADSAYLGFTGSSGSGTANQKVSDFSLAVDTDPLGDLDPINGFTSFNQGIGKNSVKAKVKPNQIQLTDGTPSIATAAWLRSPVPTTESFEVGFTYTAGGDQAADGIALVWQTQGLNAVGAEGGYLGYVDETNADGIFGNKAAYQINLYDYAQGTELITGTNFVVGDYSMKYKSTDKVNLASGNPIKVTLVYDAEKNTLTETLLDTITNEKSERPHDVDLASALGQDRAYLGFTGGSGASTAIQVVSDFHFALKSQAQYDFHEDLSASLIGAAPTVGVPYSSEDIDPQNYPFPEAYKTQLTTRVRADHPIGIDFSQIRTGNLQIGTDSDLTLNGRIRLPGNVQISSGGSIAAGSSGSVSGQNVTLIAKGNDATIGAENAPLKLSLTDGSLTAVGLQGIYISSPGDLPVNLVVNEPVVAGFAEGAESWSTVNKTQPLTGLQDFVIRGNATFVDGESLTLSDNTMAKASAAWYPHEISTAKFNVSFTYQASGDMEADGVAFVLQNQGTHALGENGSRLGYVGIPGNKAAYQMNLYNYGQGSELITGTNFVTTDTSASYHATGEVDLASGNPIDVQLFFDSEHQTVIASLKDTATDKSYSHTYTDIELPSLLGKTAWFGFTGATGSGTSIQTISNFEYQSELPLLFGPELTLTSSSGISQQASAAWLTETVKTDTPLRIEFVYQADVEQAGGIGAQGGTALVWQNEGPNAIGNTSEAKYLAYHGIVGNSAAYQINLDDNWTVGTQFATNGKYGSYQSTGDVDLASGHPIKISLTYVPSTSHLVESLLDLKTGQSWQTKHSVNLEQVLDAKETYFGFTAASSERVGQKAVDLLVINDVESLGEIVLTAKGNIIAQTDDSLIRAGVLTLNSNSGAIGTKEVPLRVQLDSQTLENGTIQGGILNATAQQDITVLQPTDDLRVGKIQTPGTVQLTTMAGRILDGLSLDSAELNRFELTPEQRQEVLGFLSSKPENPVKDNVSSFEAAVNARYLMYWRLTPPVTIDPSPTWNAWDPGDWGEIVTITDPQGISRQIYQLTSTGIEALRPVYEMASEEQIPASDSEVQQWADLTWQQCITRFADPLAFGPNWDSRPQFLQYDGEYLYKASDETVASIAAATVNPDNLMTFVSEDALASPSVIPLLPIQTNIQAGNLELNSTDSIGLYQETIEISLDAIANQELTVKEKEILRTASRPGEILIVGWNELGEKVYYEEQQPPNNVIPTALQIAFHRPLVTEIASTGSLSATADQNILITQHKGDLQLKEVSSHNQALVRIESDGNLVSSTGEKPVISAGDLNLISGGSLGTADVALDVDASGQFDAVTEADLWIASNSSLSLGEVIAEGSLNLQVEGSVTDASASKRNSFSGFNEDGTGWTAVSTTGSAVVSSDTLVLTNDITSENQDPSTVNSTSFPSEVTFERENSVELNNDFEFGFLYKTKDTSGRFAISLANANQSGLALILNLSGSQWSRFAPPHNIPNATSGYALQSVRLNSNHPIQVLWHYSAAKETARVSFTDTITGEHFTFTKANLNLTEQLGGTTAQLSLISLGDGISKTKQTITDFNLIDGPPNLDGPSLNAQVTGNFGSPAASSPSKFAQPVIINIPGEININAGGDVIVENLQGNLHAGSITGQSVSLSAPFGNITNSTPTTINTESNETEGETRSGGIFASDLVLDAQMGIGHTDSPLLISADRLSAKTTLKDLRIANGAFDETGETVISQLVAEGTIDLTSAGSVKVQGDAVANQAINIHITPGAYGGQLHLAETAQVIAQDGPLQLFASESIRTEFGSLLKSNENINLEIGSTAGMPANQAQLNLSGTIHSAELRADAGKPGQYVQLTITHLIGLAGDPLPVFLNRFHHLHVDDSQSQANRDWHLGQRQITTDLAQIQLGDIQTVVMDLGDGDDTVTSQDGTGLSSLKVQSGEGKNKFDLTLHEPSLTSVNFVGGADHDQFKLDGRDTALWISQGKVETGNTQIKHSGMDHLVLDNLEPDAGTAAQQKIELAISEFAADKLLLVGTAGRDAVEVNAQENDISVRVISNENDRQQKNFSTSHVNELEIVLLAGDDFVQVTGQDPSELEPFTLQIDGGRGDDWISADTIRIEVTDMQGNNTITTGPANDEIHTGDGNDGIDAGQGENTIRDAGGVNRIITGQNDDSIYHANSDDWIFASDGVNQIWLNGVKTNWHNQETPEDVNRDQLVTPLDALILINQLNQTGSYPLIGSADTVSYYYDTNNDDYLTPIDVLRVINYLNRPLAEGENDSDHGLVAKPNGNRDQITDACFATWEPASERSAEIADRLTNHQLLPLEKTSAPNGSPLHGIDNELPKRLKQRTYQTW